MTPPVYYFVPAQLPSEDMLAALVARYGEGGALLAHVSTSGNARTLLYSRGAEVNPVVGCVRMGRVSVMQTPALSELDERGICRCGCGVGRRADGSWYDAAPTVCAA